MSISLNINFLGILGLVSIILKLMKVITWSWFYVLIPFYLPVLLVLIGFLFVALVEACIK